MESSNATSGLRVLLGVTGGIAVVKAPQIISALKREGCSVRVVMTSAAARFVTPLTFESLTGEPTGLDMFTREYPREIQHISWAQWAQCALIAPATANTIGKLAAGIADNLLTSIWMALTCPVMLCPSMNTNMFENPATQSNLKVLEQRGMRVMQPAAGHLACGDSGKGRLPEPALIVSEFLDWVCGPKPLSGKRVLITAGPTCEPIDPVRYLTNRSSGKMGYALAREALQLGASVTLISGPVSLQPPPSTIVQVQTAQQMRDAVMARAADQDIIICCAAVSDYRPEHVFEQKLKKSEELELRLVKTPDILAELGAQKSCYLVGFAAETNNVDSYAQGKLEAKNLDMIVANDVSREEIGFGSDDNAVTIFMQNKPPLQLEKAPKNKIARRILEVIAANLRKV